MKFKELKKDCKYRGWEAEKCIHQKNPKYRLSGSCNYQFCPLKGELQPHKEGGVVDFKDRGGDLNE